MALTTASTDVLSPLLARSPRLARLLPRVPFLEQTARDLVMVATTLVRYRPVARTYERAAAPGKSADEADCFEVVDVMEEARGTKSLLLRRPEGFGFVAGQFVTLLLDVPGGEVRRSYSLSCAPHEDGPLRLGVKLVPGGLGSSFLHGLRAGARVRFRGPSGSFTYVPRPDEHHLVLLAGGSGITPILSIVKSALAGSEAVRIALLYAARSPGEMAHRDEIRALAARHPCLTVRFFVDDEPEPGDVHGRIGANDLHPLRAQLDNVYLCGPDPMMDALVGVLGALSVAPDRIHRERFFTPRKAPLPARRDKVRLRVHGVDLAVDPRRTLLESTLEAGLPVRYSCTMGGCGECRAQLEDGQVSMAEPNCLTEEERRSGTILPCVSHPLTDVTLDYPNTYTSSPAPESAR